MHRLLKQVAIVLAVAAVAVPLARGTSYDGYKSSYPQLHQLASGAAGSDVDYKSSYPQLHAVLSHQAPVPISRTVSSGFDWSDAAIGAAIAAGAIFLIASAALFFSRRHTRFAV